MFTTSIDLPSISTGRMYDSMEAGMIKTCSCYFSSSLSVLLAKFELKVCIPAVLNDRVGHVNRQSKKDQRDVPPCKDRLLRPDVLRLSELPFSQHHHENAESDPYQLSSASPHLSALLLPAAQDAEHSRDRH